jgi:phage terminase large subunit-like protein
VNSWHDLPESTRGVGGARRRAAKVSRAAASTVVASIDQGGEVVRTLDADDSGRRCGGSHGACSSSRLKKSWEIRAVLLSSVN